MKLVCVRRPDMPPDPANNKEPDREKELQEQIRVTGQKLTRLRKDLLAEQQRKAYEEAKVKKRVRKAHFVTR